MSKQKSRAERWKLERAGSRSKKQHALYGKLGAASACRRSDPKRCRATGFAFERRRPGGNPFPGEPSSLPPATFICSKQAGRAASQGDDLNGETEGYANGCEASGRVQARLAAVRAAW